MGLGLIKNDLGDFVDLPFSAGPSLTDHGGTYSHVDFTEADYLALRDLILAVPASQLESKFKKLSYEGAERYGLGIFSGAIFYPIARDGASYAGASTTPVSGTHWKQNGLVVPNSLTNFFKDSYGAFTLWGTGDGFTKWTTTPSYAAADVGALGNYQLNCRRRRSADQANHLAQCLADTRAKVARLTSRARR